MGESRVAQVRGRVGAHQLRGLEDRVEHGSDLGAAGRLGAVVILATDDGPADPSLGGVVVSGIRVSSRGRVSRSQLATTYAAALPMDSVLSVVWVQSQVFIVAITLALSVTDLAEFMSTVAPTSQVLFGAFPNRDNDGTRALTVTLPDLDGVVRSHPH